MSRNRHESNVIWSHSKVYGIGSIVNSAGGLILIPLYVHVLSPLEFGVYSIVVIAVEFAGVLLSNAVGTGMARVYLDSDDHDRQAITASTTFICFVAIALLLAIASYPLSVVAGQLLFSTIEWNQVIFLAFLSSIFNLLLALELNYFRLRKLPWVFLGLSAAKMLLMIGVNYLLLVYFSMGLLGLVAATTVSFAMVSIPALGFILTKTGIHFNRAVVKRIAHLSLPLIPGKLSDIGTQFFDRYLIGLFVGVGPVGYYALAQKLTSVLQLLVISPFAQIWIVRRLETLDERKNDEIFQNIFRFFLAILTSIALGTAMFAPEAISIIADEAFIDAAGLVPLLCFAAVLMPIDMNLQLGILYASKTKYMMLVSMISAVINLLSMLVLIPPFGAAGAAIGVIITNLTRIGLTGYYGNRYCGSRIRTDGVIVTSLLLVASGIYIAGHALTERSSLMVAIMVKFGLWLCYSAFAAIIVTDRQSREMFFNHFRSHFRVK